MKIHLSSVLFTFLLSKEVERVNGTEQVINNVEKDLHDSAADGDSENGELEEMTTVAQAKGYGSDDLLKNKSLRGGANNIVHYEMAEEIDEPIISNDTRYGNPPTVDLEYETLDDQSAEEEHSFVLGKGDEDEGEESNDYEDFYGDLLNQNNRELQLYQTSSDHTDEHDRLLASSSFNDLGTAVRSVAGDPDTKGAWQGAAVGGAVLLGCMGVAAATTAAGGVGLILGAMCPFASFLAGALCDSCLLGNPNRDNAWITVKAADIAYGDGDALNVAFHRSNGERDNRAMGYIRRGQRKGEVEDLDAAHLRTLEFFVKDRDDVCIQSIAVKLGVEPSGTGKQETLILDASMLAYLTRWVGGSFDRRGKCMWFGDEKNSISNMKINWPSALQCRNNFAVHTSDDYAKCMMSAMKYLTFNNGSGRIVGWNLGSGNLSSYQKRPYQHISSRHISKGTVDLHRRITKNGQPINLIEFKYGQPAQLWDFGADGRIRSVVNPTKCLEAGTRGTLYGKAYIHDCHDGAWQQWEYTRSGRVRNKHHGKYLGIAYCGQRVSRGNNALELRNYENGACGEAQKWWVRGV